jgi:hypothetical protein
MLYSRTRTLCGEARNHEHIITRRIELVDGISFPQDLNRYLNCWGFSWILEALPPASESVCYFANAALAIFWGALFAFTVTKLLRELTVSQSPRS